MIVPDYWAEARRQHREPGRQITVRRFGWSTVSAEDATAMAEQRAEEALRRLVAGERLSRREPRVAYNGAEGVPIREEVVSRHGEEVVTRNVYGARCLNTPQALFADIDFEIEVPGGAIVAIFAMLVVAAAALGVLTRSAVVGAMLFVAALVFSMLIAHLVCRALVAVRGGIAAVAHRRLDRFLTRHPDWGVRVYATPNGLRLLATHRPFDPTEPEVAALFRAVGADRVYVQMCLNQRCFRARLTAKPWRMGMTSHLRPRPGVWPVAPERLDDRNRWIAEYETLAAKFAACRYLDSRGSGVVHERLRSVVELHDRESRALSESPLG